MKNATSRILAAAFAVGVLLSVTTTVQAHDKVPANVSGLAGAVLQQNINEFNRCNPNSPQYQGYACNGIVTLPDANIHFMNSNGVEVTPEEFNKVNHSVPEAHGIYKNPDGSIELR